MSIIRVIALLLGLFFVLVGYSYFIEPGRIVVESRIFSMKCLHSDLADKSLVQISDLHFTEKTSDERINNINGKITAIDPSFVFITGDFISDAGGIEPAARLVGRISKNYPVYAVFGNWDHQATDYNVSGLKAALENAGASVLVNRAANIKISNETITLLGVNDPYTSVDGGRDLMEAVTHAGNSGKQCKILLAHSPDIIKRASENNIDLVLVGHTHGGQIHLPLITEKIIPAKAEGVGFVAGLYSVGNTQMYVNRGIGTSVFPLRFLAPPEITVITLKKAG